jgi:hypothetical protein
MQTPFDRKKPSLFEQMLHPLRVVPLRRPIATEQLRQEEFILT